jgi:hypothetical protein
MKAFSFIDGVEYQVHLRRIVSWSSLAEMVFKGVLR